MKSSLTPSIHCTEYIATRVQSNDENDATNWQSHFTLPPHAHTHTHTQITHQHAADKHTTTAYLTQSVQQSWVSWRPWTMWAGEYWFLLSLARSLLFNALSRLYSFLASSPPASWYLEPPPLLHTCITSYRHTSSKSHPAEHFHVVHCTAAGFNASRLYSLSSVLRCEFPEKETMRSPRKLAAMPRERYRLYAFLFLPLN